MYVNIVYCVRRGKCLYLTPVTKSSGLSPLIPSLMCRGNEVELFDQFKYLPIIKAVRGDFRSETLWLFCHTKRNKIAT